MEHLLQSCRTFREKRKNKHRFYKNNPRFTSPVHRQRVQLLHHLFAEVRTFSHRSISSNQSDSFDAHVNVKMDYDLDVTVRFGETQIKILDGPGRC